MKRTLCGIPTWKSDFHVTLQSGKNLAYPRPCQLLLHPLNARFCEPVSIEDLIFRVRELSTYDLSQEDVELCCSRKRVMYDDQYSKESYIKACFLFCFTDRRLFRCLVGSIRP